MSNNILNRFTTHYKKSIALAYGLSLAQKKKEIELEDIFSAIGCEKGSLGYETLTKAGIKRLEGKNCQSDGNRANLEKIIQSKEQIPLSSQAETVITESTALAAKYSHNYIGTEHLLYSLINLGDETINKILETHRVKPRDLLKNLEIILSSTSKFSDMTDAVQSIQEKIKQDKRQARQESDSMLDFFGTELTNQQIQKGIDPIIGRGEEINRVIQILSRRNKNNPILLGEPGVGKTAIVEGLAKKIMEAQVPDLLLNRRIYSLDMPLLVAGTSYRGEFEARIKQIVDEVKSDPNIILFIDEIHNIMGAGSASGTMDAANILKPALSRGEIRCIGATTYDDYKKHIEPDNALVRRLQKVIVKESTPEEAITILKGIKDSYEKHHLVEITDEAIEEAVNLSMRYVVDQFLPDKAIDLIDEAASKKRISQPRNSNYQKIAKLKKELMEITNQKNSLVAQSKYSQALKLKEREREILNQLDLLEEAVIKNKINLDSEDNQSKISRGDIRNLVAEATKIRIPETNQFNQDTKYLAGSLNKKIIGQKQAIEQLTNTLKRSAVGLAGDRRPLGSFIFAGPSGVGKTYAAKILAEHMSPGQEGLIKLDMSEFGEKFNASKILGAPAGYIGYDEGGVLTEKVKRNPYAVILLDEIEKAHPDIFNLFLQILEDGYLTDSKGRYINFRNTIIIMTTNLGLKKRAEKQNLGFGGENQDALQTSFKESLAEFLRPELLNRIDQVLVFNALTQKDLAKITRLELDNVNKNLTGQSLTLQWDKQVIDQLLFECQNQDQGARAVRGVLRERVENPLAEKILDGNLTNKKVGLKVKSGKIVFEVN